MSDVAALRRLRANDDSRLTLSQFKAMVREQFFLLLLDEEAALAAIPKMLPANLDQRRRGLAVIREVLSAAGEVSGGVGERFMRIARLFDVEGDVSAERMDVAVHALDGAEIGRRNCHEMEVDRQEMLADDVQPGGRQHVMDVGHAPRDGVLDGNHGKAGRPFVHGRQGVLEGRTGERLPIGTGLRTGRVGIGAQLTLEGNKLAHDVLRDPINLAATISRALSRS